MPAHQPSDELTVRAATAADLPVVTAIYDAEVLGGVATFALTPTALDHWRQRLASTTPGDHVLVAEWRAEVVGYASSSACRPREDYARTRETSVYLADGARGRGVGRALYDALLDRLRADG